MPTILEVPLGQEPTEQHTEEPADVQAPKGRPKGKADKAPRSRRTSAEVAEAKQAKLDVMRETEQAKRRSRPPPSSSEEESQEEEVPAPAKSRKMLLFDSWFPTAK